MTEIAIYQYIKKSQREHDKSMKINKIEPILCDSAWGVWVFIKVQTDEGITGWGECSDHRGCTYGLLGCVKDLELALIGKDPRPVEK